MSGDVVARNIAVVREHIAAEVAKDVARTLATMVDEPTYDIVIRGEPMRGRAAVAGHLQRLFATFPDFTIAIDDIVADERKVVCELTLRGTHGGPFLDVAPTGRPVEFRLAAVFTSPDGKIVQETAYYDALTILRQIGAR
jgi:steroid delta-isomerase-like uncharacterized protein